MDLLGVRSEVGKHCAGSKDGYAVRRLKVSSKVVVGSRRTWTMSLSEVY